MSVFAASSTNTQKVIRISNYADYDIASVNGELVFTLRETGSAPVAATGAVPVTAPVEPVPTTPVSNTYTANAYDFTRELNERVRVPEGTKIYNCYLNGYATSNYTGHLPNILPDSIEEIHCANTKIKFLPDPLPANLTHLRCANNYLKTLPTKLPAGLEYLSCGSNELTELPDLPETLTTFYYGIYIRPDDSSDNNSAFKSKYPLIYNNNSMITKDVIQYVNRRNREMRGEIPTRVTEAELFEYDLGFSIVKQCKIDDVNNNIICKRRNDIYNILYYDIVTDVLCNLSLPDIVASNIKVKLQDQCGRDHYQWSQKVGLSIYHYSEKETLRNLIDVVKTHNWKMIITIKLANNQQLQFVYPESVL
jgi:Leucine-rich repeat (LRR) protein